MIIMIVSKNINKIHDHWKSLFLTLNIIPYLKLFNGVSHIYIYIYSYELILYSIECETFSDLFEFYSFFLDIHLPYIPPYWWAKIIIVSITEHLIQLYNIQEKACYEKWYIPYQGNYNLNKHEHVLTSKIIKNFRKDESRVFTYFKFLIRSFLLQKLTNWSFFW